MSMHINAKPGDIAPNILMPGDPLRAKYIAEKCDGTKTGARELRNIIRREIETQVVDMVITNNAANVITATVVDGKITLTI